MAMNTLHRFRIAVTLRQQRDPAFTALRYISSLGISSTTFYDVLKGKGTSARVSKEVERFIEDEYQRQGYRLPQAA
ncbi:MAG: hypothetical protein AAGN64_11030 [Bacteroidota bacterium]